MHCVNLHIWLAQGAYVQFLRWVIHARDMDIYGSVVWARGRNSKWHAVVAGFQCREI